MMSKYSLESKCQGIWSQGIVMRPKNPEGVHASPLAEILFVQKKMILKIS